MNNKDIKYILMFIFIFLGVVSTVQFKSILNITKGKPSIAYEIERLKKDFESEKAAGNELKEAIDFNLKKQESLYETYSSNNDDGLVNAKWEEAKLYAGLSDVKGDGIIVTLNDAIEKDPLFEGANLLHDKDIYTVVNELKRGGAQAISINNERIISTTEIMCAGPTIRANRNRYAVPFEIKAIGDPKRLYATFIESEIYTEMKWANKRVEIKKANDIKIAKYSGNVDNLIKGLEVVDQ